MNKNIYDTDCVTWSPQGRIFQIEYANEATKQGTCCVAIRSASDCVLVALRRRVSKLAGHNAKVFRVAAHVGATYSGITADANIILNQMRLNAIQHEYQWGAPAPLAHLLDKVSLTSQQNTVSHGKRPYGVSLLVAGVDKEGTHIFETHPSGDVDEYSAHAFGARCQSARTYLEEHAAQFVDVDLKGLLEHALKALATTITAETGELSKHSLHVATVGKDHEFTILREDEVDALLSGFNISVAHEMAVDE